jgi:hypothetical protein
MLAQQHAEILKSRSFTDSDLTAGDHSAIGSSKGVQYTVAWNVTDNTPDTDMKTINLTVQWSSLRQGASDQTSGEKTVTARLRTIIRDRS